MNKKAILIGLGVLAVGGLAYYFFMGKGDKTLKQGEGGSSDSALPSGGASESSEEESYQDDVIGVDLTKKEVRQENRAVRRDCRKEARAKYGRLPKKKKDRDAKQKFRRDCKAAGGFDDGGADFAFNGYGNDVDNIGF